jgi:hypothetical protein
MSNLKSEIAQHEEFADANGYQRDQKGRRFSQMNGEFYDEKGRRFSGYDPIGRRISVVDDVFGEIKEGGPNYRDVSSSLQ